MLARQAVGHEFGSKNLYRPGHSGVHMLFWRGDKEEWTPWEPLVLHHVDVGVSYINLLISLVK